MFNKTQPIKVLIAEFEQPIKSSEMLKILLAIHKRTFIGWNKIRSEYRDLENRIT